MWRGWLIDRFAQLETTALQCLLAARPESCGQSGTYLAWLRFRELRKFLASADLPGVAKRALSLLEEIENHHDLRNAIAHGCMTAKQGGMVLSWKTRYKKKLVDKSIEISWSEAIETLNRLTKLQRDFASQGGQIRKACAQKVAV